MPSAQSEKRAARGSFSLRGSPPCRMEIRRRQTSAQSASESAALGEAGYGSAGTATGCAFGAEQKRAVRGSFSLRGGTPHPPRQARHLPPLGKAKDHFCFHAVCKVSAVSMVLWELYSRNLTRPSPAGEGGTRSVTDEVFTHCGNGSSRDVFRFHSRNASVPR